MPNLEQQGIEIFHNGGKIPASAVSSLSVFFKLNEISFVQLQGEMEDWLISDLIIIKKSEAIIFSGMITHIHVKKAENGIFRKEFKISHPSYKTKNNLHQRIFANLSNQEILQEMFSFYSIPLKTDFKSLTSKKWLQNQRSDWDFALDLAKISGAFVSVENEFLTIQCIDFTPENTTSVAQETILDLNLSIDATAFFNQATGRFWDFSSQENLEIVSDKIPEQKAGNQTAIEIGNQLQNPSKMLAGRRFSDIGTLPLLAENLMKFQEAGKIKGEIILSGYFGLVPGNWLNLHNIHRDFNGNHFISEVEIHFSESETKTILKVGYLDENLKNEVFTPTSDLQKQHLAKVVQLEGDPDGEDRILVELTDFENGKNQIWARLNSVGAGNEKGLVFLPDINDEVLVCFENSDVIILGSLHSSAKPSPISVRDDNAVKGIFTVKNKMIFDDFSESISVQTKNAEIKIQSQNDGIEILYQNQKIQLNEDGIFLNSDKDLVLKASGKIKIEGGSALELESSATTTIKGAIVQIN